MLNNWGVLAADDLRIVDRAIKAAIQSTRQLSPETMEAGHQDSPMVKEYQVLPEQDPASFSKIDHEA